MRRNVTAPTVIAALCRQIGLQVPIGEYRFDSVRKWRFDWAWPAHLVALEVEGGVWTRGRHVRGAGYLRDMTKYNRATLLGWRVIRCTPSTLTTGLQLVADLLHSTLDTYNR